jgi:hypothetical protein
MSNHGALTRIYYGKFPHSENLKIWGFSESAGRPVVVGGRIPGGPEPEE